MVVIITAAAAGIVAVSLLNRESKWNRVGGIAAVVLGCALAMLLLYGATSLPDTASVLLTVGLTSFLLVLVSILVSLLCRGRQVRRKEAAAAPEQREKKARSHRRAAYREMEPAVLPDGLRWEAEPLADGARPGKEARAVGADKGPAIEKPPEEEAGRAEERAGDRERVPQRIRTEAAAPQPDRRENAEERAVLAGPEANINRSARQEQEKEPEPKAKEDRPVQRELEKPQAAEEDKREAMERLKALVAGREYGAALKQAFYVLRAGYALRPEEKERLRVMLRLLKEKAG